MEEITEDALMMLRKSIDLALDEVGREHNLKIQLGNISYGKTYFSGKIEAQVIGAKTKRERDYECQYMFHNLPPLGVEVVLPNGEMYKCTGWKSSARKNKVIIQSTRNWQTYVCRPDFLRGWEEVDA